MSYKKWKEEEIQILKEKYPNKRISIYDIQKELPERSLNAIRAEANRRTIHRYGRLKTKYKTISLLYETIPEGFWMILQSINEYGDLMGTGFFRIEPHDEEYEKQREHYRKHCLSTKRDGKIIKWKNLNKRDYFGKCEMCGSEKEFKFDYHHWNDNKPDLGMWLCFKCHAFAEMLDKITSDKAHSYINSYYKLKEKILNVK